MIDLASLKTLEMMVVGRGDTDLCFGLELLRLRGSGSVVVHIEGTEETPESEQFSLKPEPPLVWKENSEECSDSFNPELPWGWKEKSEESSLAFGCFSFNLGSLSGLEEIGGKLEFEILLLGPE